MNTTWKVIGIVSLLALATGCFEIDGEHTLFLEPDGSVTWTIEEEVTHTGEDEAARQAEIDGFLRDVAAGRNGASRALRLLAPATLDSRVLRADPPLAIRTEARFAGIDDVYRNVFDVWDLKGRVELTGEGDVRTLRVTVLPGESAEVSDVEADEAAAAMLLAVFLECRIVLTEGRFLEARGFALDEKGREARPIEIEEEENQPIELMLSWTRSPE